MMNSLTDRLLRLAMINSSAQVRKEDQVSYSLLLFCFGLDLYENK